MQRPLIIYQPGVLHLRHLLSAYAQDECGSLECDDHVLILRIFNASLDCHDFEGLLRHLSDGHLHHSQPVSQHPELALRPAALCQVHLWGALTHQVLHPHVIDGGEVLELIGGAQVQEFGPPGVEGHQLVPLVCRMRLHRVRVRVPDVDEGVGHMVVELSCREQEPRTQDVQLGACGDRIEILHT